MLRKARPLAFWKSRSPATQASRFSPRHSPSLPYQDASTTAHRNNMQLTALLSRGDTEAVRRLFDGIPRRTVVTWNAMVAGHARRGSVLDALDIAARMHRSEVSPNEVTFASVLGACARGRCLRVGAQVHCQVVKSGCEDFAVVGCSLLDFYSSSFDLPVAHTLFESLRPRNELLWSPMVVALVRFNLLSDALDFLERMPAPRDVFAWTAVILGYARGANEDCRRALELFVRMLADDGCHAE